MKAVLSTLMTTKPTAVAVKLLTSAPTGEEIVVVKSSSFLKFILIPKVAAKVMLIAITHQTPSAMPHATIMITFHAISTRAETAMEEDLDTTGEH